MKLNEYVALAVAEQGRNKTAILRDLASKSKVSLLTLQGVERGATMQVYDKAQSVSRATGGAVSIPELCEHSPEKPKPVKKTRSKARKA